MPSLNEKRAAEVLHQILGGTVLWKDTPGAPSNTHDFEIRCPNGVAVAVEVTRVTDQHERAFWAAVRKSNWSAPSLQRSWMLVVYPHSQINKLRAKVEALLSDLERDHVYKFGLREAVPEVAAGTVQRLKTLGARAGRALDFGPPVILISTVGAGVTHPDLVSSVLEQEATKMDNRAKLRRAEAAERHLFVWVEDSAHQVAAAVEAMRDLEIMPSTINLPDDIGVVWVAKATAVPGQETSDEDLWRFDRSDGWLRIK